MHTVSAGLGSELMQLEASTLRKVRWHIVPFVALLYFAAFIDRVSISFAAPQMSRDLGLSEYVYGLGAGLFFIGYCLFEVPSNLVLYRIGARRWIGRIMISWSIVAGAMAFARGTDDFYVLRFALGVAEAGFFPGVVYYLSAWVPSAHRARLIGGFMTAIPISTALGGPLASAILHLDGVLGVAGWRWLLLCETVPSFLLGWLCWFQLRDAPAQAGWLQAEERAWLAARLQHEHAPPPGKPGSGVLAALTSPRTLCLSLCYFGVVMALYGVVLWLPLIIGALGIGRDAVGYIILLAYSLVAAGMLWWSRRSDRAHERVRHLAAASLVGFLGIGASAFLDHHPALAILAITIGALGTLSVLPIFWSLSTALLSGAPAAAAIALINVVGNLGGFAGPYLIGWLKSVTGSFRFGLLAVAAGVLLTGVIATLIGAPVGAGVQSR